MNVQSISLVSVLSKIFFNTFFRYSNFWIDLNKTLYIFINNATPFEKFFSVKYANLESAIIRSGSQGKLISI